MKNSFWKLTLLLMLSLAMVFCLAACGDDEPAPADDGGEDYADDGGEDIADAGGEEGGGDDLAAAKDSIKAKYAELQEVYNETTGYMNEIIDAGGEIDPDDASKINEAGDMLTQLGEQDLAQMADDEVYALDEQMDTLLAEMYAAKDRVEALYG